MSNRMIAEFISKYSNNYLLKETKRNRNTMNPKDLRVGNLIQDNNRFEMYVCGIFKDEVLCDFESNQGDVWEYSEKELEFLNPIPITVEWLEKLGLENLSYGYEIKIIPDLILRVIVNNGNYYPQLEQANRKGKVRVIDLLKIEKVHHLQNLYFALTGEELTIKL